MKKAPEKNFVGWDKDTFNRLVVAKPEPLVSRFAVSHGMLLNVLSRSTDGCLAMRKLLADCHDSKKQKQHHKTRAWQLFRSLVNRGIVEFIPKTPEGAKLRVNLSLQDDFSMDQTLSLYLLETIPLLDAMQEDYPFKLMALIESILENPDMILRKQLDKIKTIKMAEMKMEGVPFDERIEELDKLEYPKPYREFIYSSFNDFSDRHPWVGQENIRPKSIVLEMFETYSSFADYIRTYDLHRSEGLLLRHINSVFKVLSQTVPTYAKNEVIDEMEAYLATMLCQVDSSLLDEWEKMQNPDYLVADTKDVRPPGAEEAARDITRDAKKFTGLIRSSIFSFISALNRSDFEFAIGCLSQPSAEQASDTESGQAKYGIVTEGHLAQSLESYHSTHKDIRLDAEARNLRHTYITKLENNKQWRVQQMLIDSDEANDWVLEFTIDLAQSRAQGEPALALVTFGSLV